MSSSRARRTLERVFWAVHSRTYDDKLAEPSVTAHVEELSTWLTESASLDPVVLDVGCGTGNLAVALARRGGRVVGVDFSPAMIARARAKTGPSGLDVRYREADLRAELPFDDGVFDAAICVAVLQFIDDPVRLLGEVKRTLRPSGVFLLDTYQPDIEVRAPAGSVSMAHRTFWSAKSALSRRPRSVRRYWPTEIDALLATVGFEVAARRSWPGRGAVLATCGPRPS